IMAKGNNWGWFWLILIIGLVGGGYLYQREGGMIFGPRGVVATVLLSPPRTSGLVANWNTGVFSHDLLLTNRSSSDLTEVDLTITLYRKDGQKPVVKQFWSRWAKGETKKINVPSHQYQKVSLTGTALKNLDKNTIDDA